MEKQKKIRASFYNSASDTSKKVDFLAKDSEEAFEKAMKMPEAGQRWLYDNGTVEETYFCAAPGYDADATLEGREGVL